MCVQTIQSKCFVVICGYTLLHIVGGNTRPCVRGWIRVPVRARIRIRVPVRARPTTKVSELTYNTLQVSKFECPPND